MPRASRRRGRGLVVASCWLAIAAEGPATAATFPADTLRLPTERLTFPTETLRFPSELQRVETPTTIEVELPADILFDFDKMEIRANAAPTLHEVADLIRAKGRGPVTIQGYTDGLGAEAYNQRLSERRAAAVKAWLVSHEGLPPGGFAAVGFGSRNPVAANRRPDGADDPEGRQRNRRVTLIIRR